MRTRALILLSVIPSLAHAQDFKRASDLKFEYTRTDSEGRVWGYSTPAHPRPLLAILATATRLGVYPKLSFVVAVEGQTTIDGVYYRLFFPRVPPREAPYVFAAGRSTSPADRTYFEIPREHFPEFTGLFQRFLSEHRDALLK